MGAGIAEVAALSGFEVILSDVSEQVLAKALERITGDFRKSVERGKISPAQSDASIRKIRTSTTFDPLSGADAVIEAATESLQLKQEIFRRLESAAGPEAILATNTSSLSITTIASAVSRPERVIGMHFFNPAHIMKLVEIVPGHRTSEAATLEATALAERLGKIPVLAKDAPGFIVNRIARPFYGEALRLLGEGVATVGEIDRIVKLEAGFAMGPFELMDLIGIDVNYSVTLSIYEQSFGEPRYRPHAIQRTMVGAGKLGRKTGEGFYRYTR